MPLSPAESLAATTASVSAWWGTVAWPAYRPPGKYSIAVSSQRPQHVETPRSIWRSAIVVAPSATAACTWRSVIALQIQINMRTIIICLADSRKHLFIYLRQKRYAWKVQCVHPGPSRPRGATTTPVRDQAILFQLNAAIRGEL